MAGRRTASTEVVLACGFLPDVLREALGEEERARGARSPTCAEPEPLGTAGAIRFAADALGDRLEERFLALNGDVLADLDLTALLRAHEERGARRHDRAPPRRGLLRLRAGPLRRRAGAVLEFLEKTGEAVPGRSTPAPTCSSARCST